MKIFAGILTVIVAGGLIASRAEDPEQPRRSSGIQGEVAVHLVQLPLLATDRQGRPVRDLTPAEIQVKLRGKPARVSHLDPAHGTAPAVDVRLHLDAPGAAFEEARPMLGGSKYLVVFVDVDNDSPVLRDETARAVAEFLRTQLPPAARVSVFSYDGTLHMDLPFTDDRNAAASAVTSAYSRAGRPRMDPRTRMQRLLRSMEGCVEAKGQFSKTADPQCLRDLANDYTAEVNPRAEEFVRALQEMVHVLGGLRGRKSVLALSHGIPVEAGPILDAAARGLLGDSQAATSLQSYVGFGSSPRHEMDVLLESLVREKVSLSFLDRIPAPSGDFQASRGEMLAAGMSPMRAEYDATAADMGELASFSGGLRVQSTDVSKGLRKLTEAIDGSYDLGFVLDEYVDAKSLSKVDVSCSRRGVKLTYSRGVYVPAPREERVMKGRFVLSKTVALGPDRSGSVRQPFRVEIDPHEIGYEVKGDDAHANFTIDLEVLSPASGELANSFHFVSHDYDSELWKQGAVAPVTFMGWIEAPPGAYVLRAWIRNTMTQREGGITGPIAIRAVP